LPLEGALSPNNCRWQERAVPFHLVGYYDVDFILDVDNRAARYILRNTFSIIKGGRRDFFAEREVMEARDAAYFLCM
jgi:hypothetical protein